MISSEDVEAELLSFWQVSWVGWGIFKASALSEPKTSAAHFSVLGSPVLLHSLGAQCC